MQKRTHCAMHFEFVIAFLAESRKVECTRGKLVIYPIEEVQSKKVKF